MEAPITRLSVIIILNLFVIGVIILSISVFNPMMNYGGSIAGYLMIGLGALGVIFLIGSSIKSATDSINIIMRKIMNLCPFVILLISILVILINCSTYKKLINDHKVSADYYTYYTSMFFTVVVLVSIYLYGIFDGNYIVYFQNPVFTKMEIPFALAFFSLWFFAYTIIIGDILKYYTTDERIKFE